jgi:hypothetical protein
MATTAAGLNRKRVRDQETTKPQGAAHGTASSTSSSSSTLPARKPPGYMIQSQTWLPCSTPKEDNIPLDFNFWMRSRYISDAEVHEFILSVLCDSDSSPLSSSVAAVPSFISKSWKQFPKSKRVVVISLQGVNPKELSDLIANASLPELLSFSSVPVRHTISATLQHLPMTANVSLPENYWKYNDTAPSSSLLFWPIVPAVSYEKVSSYHCRLLALFAHYRLVFKVCSSSEEPHLASSYDLSLFRLLTQLGNNLER